MRLLVAIALLAFPAAAEELDRWLPARTYVYVSVEDAVRTHARWRAGRWRSIMGEPAAQRLALRFEALLNGVRRDQALAGRAWPGRLWTVAEGQMVFAVVEGPHGPRPLLLLEAGARFERHLGLLRDSGVLGRWRVHDYRGAQLVSHRGSPEEGPGGTLWHLRRGRVAAVAWEREVLERLVDGPGSTLAGRAAYRAVRRRLERDSDIVVFLDGETLGEMETVSRYAGRMLKVAGADKKSALGLGLALRETGLGLRLFLHVPGKRTGARRLLDVGNEALTPPAFLPRGIASFSSMRIDLRRFARDLHAVAREIDPELAAEIPGDPERFLRYAGGDTAVELFSLLGDEFVGAQLIPNTPRIEIAEIRRPGRLATMLEALPRRHVENGVTIHSGRDGMSFAVLGKWLVAGRHLDYVRLLADLHGGKGEALASSPTWRLANTGLPERGFARWYDRTPPRRDWRHWSSLVDAQAGILVNLDDGLLVAHFAVLASR